jgi:hypothetical protein
VPLYHGQALPSIAERRFRRLEAVPSLAARHVRTRLPSVCYRLRAMHDILRRSQPSPRAQMQDTRNIHAGETRRDAGRQEA